ncbi:PilZ domain-containing protein [Qipengyuania sp. MTN3-11]|uniref:PilZ domain-containing protein n=1 Tax=Qipengyuania sp. MTN3-11 TaxID=3056557 RepID=UPI0036F4342C
MNALLANTQRKDHEMSLVATATAPHDTRGLYETDGGYAVDRREHQRVMTIYRVARVLMQDDQALALLRNISDKGVSLSISRTMDPGEHLRVQLSDSVEVQGEVVWSQQDMCGVEFDQAVDCRAILGQLVEEAATGKARALRLPTNALAMVDSEAGMVAARIQNVSQAGAALKTRSNFKPGMHVRIRTVSGIERRGTVRWSDDGWAGVQLIEPIGLRQLGSARFWETD